MSGGFLKTLAARTLGLSARLDPIVPSRFEPQREPAEIDVEEENLVSRSILPIEAERDQVRPRTIVHQLPYGSSDEIPMVTIAGPESAARGRQDRAPSHTSERGEPRPTTESAEASFANESSEALRGTEGAESPRTIQPGSNGPSDTITRVGGVARARESFSGDFPSGRSEPPLALGSARAPGTIEQLRMELDDQALEAGTVVVRIGRIDVRAVTEQATPREKPSAPKRSRPSLAEHLRARDEGRR